MSARHTVLRFQLPVVWCLDWRKLVSQWRQGMVPDKTISSITRHFPRWDAGRVGAWCRTGCECMARSRQFERDDGNAESLRGSPMSAILADDFAKLRDVEDANVFLLDGNQPFVLKTREHPAHCFQFQPEIASDFLTGHAQIEF